jgi:hypothetical protein
MSSWEVYKFEGRTATPKLTIRKGGQIGLNSAAVRKYKLDKYGYAVLLINQEEGKIGVLPTNDEGMEGRRSIKIVQGGASIPSKSFIEYYELDKVKENRMKCEWDDEHEMIVAEYKK